LLALGSPAGPAELCSTPKPGPLTEASRRNSKKQKVHITKQPSGNLKEM